MTLLDRSGGGAALAAPASTGHRVSFGRGCQQRTWLPHVPPKQRWPAPTLSTLLRSRATPSKRFSSGACLTRQGGGGPGRAAPAAAATGGPWPAASMALPPLPCPALPSLPSPVARPRYHAHPAALPGSRSPSESCGGSLRSMGPSSASVWCMTRTQVRARRAILVVRETCTGCGPDVFFWGEGRGFADCWPSTQLPAWHRARGLARVWEAGARGGRTLLRAAAHRSRGSSPIAPRCRQAARLRLY